jgi:hypothetical protein
VAAQDPAGARCQAQRLRAAPEAAQAVDSRCFGARGIHRATQLLIEPRRLPIVEQRAVVLSEDASSVAPHTPSDGFCRRLIERVGEHHRGRRLRERLPWIAEQVLLGRFQQVVDVRLRACGWSLRQRVHEV